MALTLVKETLHLRDTYRRDSNTFGRPRAAVRGSEDLQRAEDIIEIVHGFAFAHKHSVSETGCAC